MKKRLAILATLFLVAAHAQTLPISGGGTGATTASAALANLGADPAGSTSNKDFYVSATGSDANSGTSWGLAKLTIQAAVNAASTAGQFMSDTARIA